MSFSIKDYEIQEIFYENDEELLYHALKLPNHQPVLLKVMKSEEAGKSILPNEYDILSQIHTEHTILPYELIPYKNGYVLALEEFSSIPLAVFIETKKCDFKTHLMVAIQLAECIEEIHDKNIVLPNISPFSIFISDDNLLKFMDFSYATHADILLAKHGYSLEMLTTISPELAIGFLQKVDFRSDIYSLGATLYHLFVGSPLFTGSTPEEIIKMHLTREPIAPHEANPDIPRALSIIIMKCLKKKNLERYPNVTAIKKDLLTCQDYFHASVAIPDNLIKFEEDNPRSNEYLEMSGKCDYIDKLPKEIFVENYKQVSEEINKLHALLIQQDKLASLGQLTAGIAHELKNPLNFIINYAQMAKQSMDELYQAVLALDPANKEEFNNLYRDISESLDAVNTHGYRANDIIKGMLAHSHQGSQETEKININKLIDQAVGLAYYAFLKKNPLFNASFIKSYDPNLPPIEGFSGELIRVFINMTDNACFSLAQKLQSAPFKPVIEIKTYTQGDRVFISLKDNGLGISDSMSKKVFTPFYTTKPTGVGTGIGLTICQDIITNQHQGKLSFQSIEGQMAEFIIELPLKIRKD